MKFDYDTFLLQSLLTVAFVLTAAAFQNQETYADPHNEDKMYVLASLLFRPRPLDRLSRMYPHVISFQDMLHPGMRSFQFGFPEVLRSGMSREIAKDIIFYKKGSTISSGIHLHSKSNTAKFQNWALSKMYQSNSVPVYLNFSTLASPHFTMRGLLNMLDEEPPSIPLRTTDTDDQNYLYTDHLREFLIGTWYSMEKDSVFHPEENVWRGASQIECPEMLDFTCFWRRFFLIILSSKINTFKSVLLQLPTIDERLYALADAVGAAFWYAYCGELHQHNPISDQYSNRKAEIIKHYCPNPCRNNPCLDMAHTMTENCQIEGNGMYEKDFRCTCIETAYWSVSKRACVIYDRCQMKSPCSIAGSESCQYDPLVNEVKCFCKVGFMGPTCSEERNACFERHPTTRGQRTSGNKACNVDAGGKCIPVIGDDLFSCVCSEGWALDTSIGAANGSIEIDPNCQLRHDPCMSLPCEVGDCVSSGEQAICQCPFTHYGEHCQLRRGLWSTWGPWSSCDPDCGDKRERHRSRSCLGLECLGHSGESDWCPGGFVDCGVPERLGDYRTDRWRTAFAIRQLLFALAIATSIGVGCLFACQCFVSVALKSDRSLLNSSVRERAHIHQLLAYHRMSYKTIIKL